MRTGKKCVNCVALDEETKKIVYVSDDLEDKKFVCPECGMKMVLCAKDSEQKSPYFKHVTKTSCTGGTGESLIHRLCKEVVQNDMKYFMLPEVRASVMNKSLVIETEKPYKIERCEVETSLRSGNKLVRPDIILHVDADSFDSIIIEFKNTHGVSSLKKEYIRKMKRIVAIEVDIRPLVRLGYFPSREEIIQHIRCGCNIRYIYHETLEKVLARYKKSLFRVSSEKYLCPLTDYTVTVNKSRCKQCNCYLGVSDGLMTCTGVDCYTNPKQLLSDTTVSDRRDLYVDIPTDENKEFRLVHKRCDSCGEYLKLGVGLRGITMNGLLERVPLDTEYLYYVCVNDKCGKTYSSPIKCGNTEKIVPKYRVLDDGSIMLDVKGKPVFDTVNGKVQYTTCGGYAKALAKNSSGTNGVAGHSYGARFIGCSATEKDVSLLPKGQIKSCDASVTLFDSEEDFKRGIWSAEIRSLDGIEEFFEHYDKAIKKVMKVRKITK